MQPSYFLNPGLQSAGQFLPYQLPLQNYVQYPDIIGDGEVTSLVLPNGGFQYIFIPTFKRDSWPPYALSPNVHNPNWNFNMEAWIVRNVSNPNYFINMEKYKNLNIVSANVGLPSYIYNQQFPRANTDPQICSAPYDFRFNAPALEYHNKFHFDQCTSTTDLHYFYPSVRYTKQFDKSSACVQVDTPTRNTVYSYEVVCSKPCCCEKQKNETRTIDKHKHIDVCMSVDNVQGSTQTKKGIKVDCQCSSQKLTSDKIITTYTDQASGPYEDVHQNSLSTKKKDSTEGVGHSKAYKGRRLRGKNSPIKIFGVCETSSCYCNNTTEEEV